MKAETAGKPKRPKSGSEAWSFDVPRFDMPKVEVPAAMSEFASKSIDQAKDNYHRMAQAAEQMSDIFEKTYTTAVKSAAEYARTLAETMDSNANLAFDCARDLAAAKSFAEFLGLSTASVRKQYQALSAQNEKLMTFAQKIMTESTKPITKAASRILQTTSS